MSEEVSLRTAWLGTNIEASNGNGRDSIACLLVAYAKYFHTHDSLQIVFTFRRRIDTSIYQTSIYQVHQAILKSTLLQHIIFIQLLDLMLRVHGMLETASDSKKQN